MAGTLFIVWSRRTLLDGHSRSGDVHCHGYIHNNISLLALIPSNNTGPSQVACIQWAQVMDPYHPGSLKQSSWGSLQFLALLDCARVYYKPLSPESDEWPR